MKNVDFFRNRFYILYDYILDTQGSSYLMEQTKEVLEEACEKNDIKQLKRIDKELNVWLREMFRPDERKELEELFKEKLNENINDLDQSRIAKINKVVKRGKINNKKEYGLLLSRVDEIYDDDSKAKEVERLNSLLADFHK